MKKILLFAILMSVATISFATNVVSQEDAKIAAKNFMMELCQDDNISLDFFTLSEVEKDANGTPLYYNFNMANKGFVIVSATDLISPILAYSFESRFENREETSFFVNKYKEAIQKVRENPELQEVSAKASWNRYLAHNFTPVKTRATNAVEPLITTTWEQSRFYNQWCPDDNNASGNDDKRTLVGCVALTMSNLLYYYRFPSSGAAGAGYYHEVYGAISENFQNYTYNYDHITDNLSAYQQELAKLTYHAGVSISMNYGPNGSGAQSENVGARMRNHWKFFPGTFKSREDEAIEYADWEAMIIEELANQRPVYYSGNTGYDPVTQEALNGHAWLVDGYIVHNNANYFHVNWGWGGQQNGFYKLDALRINLNGSNESYSYGEGFYQRLAPDTLALIKPDTIEKRLSAFRGSISDGAGNTGYPLKAQYRWTIATPDAESYILTPQKIKILADDYISIYAYRNGQIVSVPIAAWQGEYLMPACTDNRGTVNVSYPGTPLPSALTVTADSILILFNSVTEPTDEVKLSSNVARQLTGFVINYVAKYPSSERTQYCSAASSPITESFGTISDKNADYGIEQDLPYRAETTCPWTIRLSDENKTAISFSFDHFDLAEGDVVEIYSAPMIQNTSTLLHRFDMNNTPSGTYKHGGNTLQIRFNADNYAEGTGFILSYDGYEGTGINQRNSGLNEMAVYPNPATDKLNIELKADQAGMITFQVLDLTGRVITTETVNHTGGALKHATSVNGLASGLYFMKVSNEKGDVTHKFIVK